MERRSIQVLKPWSAFVLYSLTTLNGEEYDTGSTPTFDTCPEGLKTEFWVKGLLFDVKVHEIAGCEEVPIYGPPAHTLEQTGGQCPGVYYRISVTWGGTFRADYLPDTPLTFQETWTTPPGEGAAGPISLVGVFRGTLPSPRRYTINVVISTGVGGFTLRLDTVGLGPGLGIFEWKLVESFATLQVWRIDGQPDNCGDPSFDLEPGPLLGYGFAPPYSHEAFVSASSDQVFALVKWGESEEESSTDYAELIYKGLDIAGALTNLGQAGHADDWRKDAVDLAPTASIEIEPSSPCLRDFLPSTNVTLSEGNLYTLDLNQNIVSEGETQPLKTLLESDPGESRPGRLTVDITIVHAVPDNDNSSVCKIGTGTPLPCRIPVPGRGSVLGVAIMPAP